MVRRTVCRGVRTRERLGAARAGFEMGVPFNELNRAFDFGVQANAVGESGFCSFGAATGGRGGDGWLEVRSLAGSVESQLVKPRPSIGLMWDAASNKRLVRFAGIRQVFRS